MGTLPPILTWSRGGTIPGSPWLDLAGYLPWLDLAGYPPPPRLDLAGYPPPCLPHGILGNVAKHCGIWVPAPRCGQTNKVKLLPSRRTTYAGGNESIRCSVASDISLEIFSDSSAEEDFCVMDYEFSKQSKLKYLKFSFYNKII